LECGDLSPLFSGAEKSGRMTFPVDSRIAWNSPKRIESGDKSPHSKRAAFYRE